MFAAPLLRNKALNKKQKASIINTERERMLTRLGVAEVLKTTNRKIIDDYLYDQAQREKQGKLRKQQRALASLR